KYRHMNSRGKKIMALLLLAIATLIVLIFTASWWFPKLTGGGRKLGRGKNGKNPRTCYGGLASNSERPKKNDSYETISDEYKACYEAEVVFVKFLLGSKCFREYLQKEGAKSRNDLNKPKVAKASKASKASKDSKASKASSKSDKTNATRKPSAPAKPMFLEELSQINIIEFSGKNKELRTKTFAESMAKMIAIRNAGQSPLDKMLSRMEEDVRAIPSLKIGLTVDYTLSELNGTVPWVFSYLNIKQYIPDYVSKITLESALKEKQYIPDYVLEITLEKALKDLALSAPNQLKQRHSIKKTPGVIRSVEDSLIFYSDYKTEPKVKMPGKMKDKLLNREDTYVMKSVIVENDVDGKVTIDILERPKENIEAFVTQANEKGVLFLYEKVIRSS
ncbi:hypothetical protein ENBRE01_2400, partial [Enteropsectra breve]